MRQNRRGRLSPRVLGLIFLVCGLIVGIPNWVGGTFTGGVMGFCLFAVLFGVLMLFMPSPNSRQ